MGDLGIALAVVAGAAAQSVSGMGFGLVAGPFLIASLGHDGLRTSILLGTLANLTGLPGRLSRVLPRQVVALWVPAAITAPLVGIAVRRADTSVLTLAAGALTVAGVVALVKGMRAPRLAGRVGAAVAGTISGAMTAIAGIGGPPVAMYAVNAGWPAARRTPTMQAYFLALNLVALASVGLPPIRSPRFAVLLAALLVGRLIGHFVAPRLSDAHGRTAVLALAAASGAVAVARGITQL